LAFAALDLGGRGRAPSAATQSSDRSSSMIGALLMRVIA